MLVMPPRLLRYLQSDSVFICYFVILVNVSRGLGATFGSDFQSKIVNATRANSAHFTTTTTLLIIAATKLSKLFEMNHVYPISQILDCGTEISETLGLSLGLDHFPGLGLGLSLENTHFSGLRLGLSLEFS